MKCKCITLAFLLGFFITSLKAQVVINEYSCANISTITDNFGNYDDWIELYNSGASAVNLAGYHLSDSKGNVTKWTFPAGITIAPSSRLLIWASGLNTVVGTNIHTSFKLTQCASEEIVFSDAAGTILDSLTILRNQGNHSRGRTTDGAATWSVFLIPTPNAANASAFKEYEPLPVFSIAPGFYPSAQSVSITCSDATALIRYTTDGSSPSQFSTVYAGPISVTTTTVIKARAYCTTDPLVPPSFVEPNTYFINVTHTVPVISVASLDLANLLNAATFATTDEVSMEYFEIGGAFQFQQVGEGGKHGNDSWAYPQRGFDYVCKDQYGYNDAINYKLFPDVTPRKKFDRVILKAAASDNYPFGPSVSCHLRDAFVQSFSQHRHFDLDCRSYKPCVLYLNGAYWGLYEIREKVNDDHYTDYYYNQDENNIDICQFWGGINTPYGSDSAWINLFNFVMSHSMNNPGAYNYVQQRLDFSSMIDNAIYNTYIVNSDWLNWNTMWWRGRDPNGQKLKWRYALWDEDNTYNLGQNFTGWPTTNANADPCDLNTSYGDTLNPPQANEGHIAILNKLLANPQFKWMYINRYADMINHDLNCDTVMKYLDQIINIITPEMPGQINKWGGTVAGWQGNIQLMKNFITSRCGFIDSALVNCYDVTGPFNLKVNVDPPGSGTVSLNSIQPLPYYIWSGKYFGDSRIPFKAVPSQTNCSFVRWEVFHHTPSSYTKDTMSFWLSANDSVVAHFNCTAPPPPPPPPPVVLPVVTEPDHTTLPNAFTPNGDGFNDVFKLLGDHISSCDMKIYNRWGQLVFSTTDPTIGWDGKFQGKDAAMDAYVYSCYYVKTDGTSNNLKGSVVLFR